MLFILRLTVHSISIHGELSVAPVEDDIWSAYDAMDHALHNMSDLTGSMLNFTAVERNEGPISLIRDQLAILKVKRADQSEEKEGSDAATTPHPEPTVSVSEQDSNSESVLLEDVKIKPAHAMASENSAEASGLLLVVSPSLETKIFSEQARHWTAPTLNAPAGPSSDSWRREFRLFELQADPQKSPIRGRILKYEPSDGLPPFEALSYFWGTEDHTEAVLILSEERYEQQAVRTSLMSALRQLRFTYRPGILWIDRFCLDWGATEVLNLQVSQKGRIFQAAENACVCLGDTSDGSDRAFWFMKQILDLHLLPDKGDWSRYREDWTAFFSLIERPWFSRIRVIQEIAFARKTMVYCGTNQISWNDLSDVITLTDEIMSSVASLKSATRSAGGRQLLDPSSDIPEDFAHKFQHSYAKKLVDVSANILRRSSDGVILERLLSLKTLVCLMSSFQYSLGRDAVYAAVALANDVSPMPQAGQNLDEAAMSDRISFGRATNFAIDAKLSVLQVCVNFIAHTFVTSGSANILVYPWAPDHPKLPSWIKSRRNASHARSSRGDYFRIHPDPLVTPDNSPGLRTYLASGTLSVSFEISPSAYLFINMRGFVLDRINNKELPALSGVIPESWPFFAGWSSRDDEAPESFWRSLVADRDHKGKNPPMYFPRACKEIFHRVPEGADIDTGKLIRDGPGAILRDFLDRVQAVTWGKRLIKTSSGRLGIAPAQTKKNDLVCILYGCDVPVVLRRTQPAKRPIGSLSAKSIEAEMVGECFIYGCVDGEALSHQESESIASVQFILR